MYFRTNRPACQFPEITNGRMGRPAAINSTIERVGERMRYILVYRCILVYYSIVYYNILYFADLRVKLLRAISLTSILDDSFVDRFNRGSQWAGGRPVRRFSGCLMDTLIHTYAHTSPQSFVRYMAHSVHIYGKAGRFLADPTPYAIYDKII